MLVLFLFVTPFYGPSLEQLARKYPVQYLSHWNENTNKQTTIDVFTSGLSTTSYSHKATSNISDLIQDLVNRHVSIDASCNCGATSQTVERCLRHCPNCIQARDYIIQTFPPRDITIFLTVHEFIDRTNRAGVVDRTTTKGIYSFFCLPT